MPAGLTTGLANLTFIPVRSPDLLSRLMTVLCRLFPPRSYRAPAQLTKSECPAEGEKPKVSPESPKSQNKIKNVNNTHSSPNVMIITQSKPWHHSHEFTRLHRNHRENKLRISPAGGFSLNTSRNTSRFPGCSCLPFSGPRGFSQSVRTHFHITD